MRIIIILLFAIYTLFANINDLTFEEKTYLKNKKTLRVYTEVANKPYSFINIDKKPSGYVNDINQMIANKLGLKIQYIESTFEKAIINLKNNDIELIANMPNNLSSSKEFLLLDKLVYEYLPSLISLNNYKKASSLKDKKIGYMEGSEHYLGDYPNNQFIAYSDIRLLINDVLEKRVDAAIDDYNRFKYFLKWMDFKKQIYLNLIEHKKFEYFISVNKENRVLYNILEKVITEEDINDIKLKWDLIYRGDKLDEDSKLTEDELSYLKNNTFNIYINNWEPFTIIQNSYNEDLQTQGIAIDFWKKLIKNLDVDYKFIKVDKFTKILEGIKNDSFGLTLSTSKTKDKEEYAVFSEIYTSYPIAIMTLNDKIYQNNIENIKGLKIAVGKNFTAHKILEKYYKNFELVLVKNSFEALDLVTKGQVYGAADILPVLNFLSRKYSYDNLKISGVTSQNYDLRIVINKKNEKLLNIVNKLIKNLPENSLTEINRKYDHIKIKETINYNYIIAILVFLSSIIFWYYSKNRFLLKQNEIIKNERQKFKFLIDNSTDGIHILDKNANVIMCSQSFADMLGYTKEEALKLNLRDWDFGITLKEKEHMETLFFKDRIFNTIHKRKDESIINVQVITKIIDIDGDSYIYASSRDITDLLNFKEMKKLNKLLDISQKLTKIGSWRHFPKTDYFWCTKEIYNIHDREDEIHYTLKPFLKDFHMEDYSKLLETIERTHKYNDIHEATFKLLTKKNNLKYIQLKWENIYDENGEISYSSGTTQDITQKVLLEIEEKEKAKKLENLNKELESVNLLLKSEKDRFELAILGADNGIFDWNILTNEIYYSPRWKSLIGYEDYELDNNFEEWEKLVHPDDLIPTKKLVEKYLSNEMDIYDATFRMQHKNGSWIWINARGKSKIEDGKPVRMVGFHTDVTELTEYRTSLENKVSHQIKEILDKKTEFETIFNSSKEPIAIIDLESNFLDFNEAYLNMIGYSREELLTKSCIGLSASDDISAAEDAMKDVIENGYVQNFEKSCYRKDGTIINVTITGALMPDKKRIILSTKDVTEKIKKDLILLEQTKMAALGEMIGNIAHQWRQPLSSITISASSISLEKTLDILDDEKIELYTSSIMNNAEYLSKTIDTFRDFIKGDKDIVNIKVDDLINNSLTIIKDSLKNNHIEVINNINPEYKNLILSICANEFIQIFINILNNSKDVIKEKNIKNGWIKIDLKKELNKVVISVEDNGGGISNTILPKIFEPYVTTKHQSQGTGLGLHMSYKIVHESLGGKLYAKNTENGAKLYIELPIKKDS